MKPVWVVQVRDLNGQWESFSVRDLWRHARDRAELIPSIYATRILRYIPATLQKKRKKK